MVRQSAIAHPAKERGWYLPTTLLLLEHDLVDFRNTFNIPSFGKFDRWALIITVATAISFPAVPVVKGYSISSWFKDTDDGNDHMSVEDISPSNYLGAAIFILYIFMALALCTNAVLTLCHSYAALPTARRNNTIFKTRLRVLLCLAVTSFVMLSYNMLSYLINSYQNTVLKHSQPQVLRRDKHEHLAVMLGVWHWMTKSTLFLDFARAICINSIEYWWTEQALIATMFSFLWMNVEGCYDSLHSKRFHVPHLYQYFLIGQILPVSFAQNLFFISLLLRPRGFSPFDVERSSSNTVCKNTATEVRHLPGLLIRCTPFAMFIMYRVLIAMLPLVATSQYFISFILFIRALLFIPLVFIFHPTASSIVAFVRLWLIGFGPLSLFPLMPWNELTISKLLFPGSGANFALNALAVDYIILSLSIVYWSGWCAWPWSSYEGDAHSSVNIDAPVECSSLQSEGINLNIVTHARK